MKTTPPPVSMMKKMTSGLQLACGFIFDFGGRGGYQFFILLFPKLKSWTFQMENEDQLVRGFIIDFRGRGLLIFLFTVEPVYNGPVLSGHPLLSGQFSKSRFFAHTNAVFVSCIRRPPCGRSMLISFFVIFTCIKRPPLNGN